MKPAPIPLNGENIGLNHRENTARLINKCVIMFDKPGETPAVCSVAELLATADCVTAALNLKCTQFASQLLPTLGNKQRPTDTTATQAVNTTAQAVIHGATQQKYPAAPATSCTHSVSPEAALVLRSGRAAGGLWWSACTATSSPGRHTTRKLNLDFQSEVIKGHRSEGVKLHFPTNTTIHTLLWLS